MCGAWSNRKKCFTVSENAFSEIPETRFGHTLAAMVNYRRFPIIIAGQDIYDPYINQDLVYSIL